MITVTTKEIDHLMSAKDIIIDIANGADDSKKYIAIAMSLKSVYSKALADKIGKLPKHNKSVIDKTRTK